MRLFWVWLEFGRCFVVGLLVCGFGCWFGVAGFVLFVHLLMFEGITVVSCLGFVVLVWVFLFGLGLVVLISGFGLGFVVVGGVWCLFLLDVWFCFCILFGGCVVFIIVLRFVGEFWWVDLLVG